IAVRQMQLGQHVFYIAGGQRLDEHFVQSFAEPMGMRTTLYWQPSPASENVVLGDERESTAAGQESLRRLLERVRNTGAASSETLERKVAGSALEEAAHAFPLLDRQQRVAAVLLVSSSREAVDALERRIRWIAMMVSAAGILLGLLISAALAARVTRPVEELGKAADEVASGNLNIRVDDSRQDELGRLAYAFNRMTRELLESHEKLVQSERVAAWRELARRLAHELKNPLFPLQITVENLLRAKEQTPEQFEEVFRESGQTLQAEIGNLKGIIERFSDFSKMPTPELQPISVNESLRQAARVYEPQFCAKGRPLITARYDLDKTLEQKSVQADFELLQRALTNLISNAVEAMPEGGYMTLRSRDDGDTVRLEVSDTGGGISKEESSRLFTPYYTSKAHGTGLGLAIAQSVVSDHGGKIWAQSEEQKGTTFVIRLPKNGARRP
ncbi:MAG TPA: ATP-binding protein, partial [Candidatus Angelobacter sp.]|nr:ATP-binding protein [Candidatus Angelobacter sp.]